MVTLGERLKRTRGERGLTQEELAAMVHVSDATINRYEKNLRRPGPEMLRLLGDALQVSADYLLGRTDDPQPGVVRERAAAWLYGDPDDLTEEELDELRKYKEWLKARRKGRGG